MTEGRWLSLILIGFLIVAGAAGATDNNTASLTTVGITALVGIFVASLGFVGSRS